MASSDNTLDDVLLALSEKSKRYLSEVGKWGKFIAIVGFVMVGLLAIFGFFAGLLFSKIPGYEDLEFPTALFGVIYLGLAAVYFFPILYLYRFSTKIRVALNENDEGILEDAFEGLKSHYKFIGILTAVMIALYLLAFFLGIIGALMSIV